MTSSILRVAKPIALVLIASLGFAAAPLPARSAPIAVVLAVVAAAAGGVAIYDYNSCDVNIIWGCSNSGGSGGGDKGGNLNIAAPSSNSPRPAVNNASKPDAASNNTTGSANPAPAACLSATANGCGMFGNGFLNASGVCSATPPPDSACPVPDGTFSADPGKVRKGSSTNLFWNVQNATACAITGGGLSLQALGISGSVPTNPIANQTVFNLTCFNGSDGGPTKSINATVNIIPSYQEI